MEIKIKKLNENAIIPSYAKPGDAGMDITAISEKVVEEKDYGYIEYGTGLAFELPEGYYMDIRPRSSISNTGMILANSPGTLDSEYRGELKIRFKWRAGMKKYEVGERVAQIMIKPYPIITFVESDLAESVRGAEGFGSTGK